jgi:hypothetical protein
MAACTSSPEAQHLAEVALIMPARLGLLPLPSRTMPISPELELRVAPIEDPAQRGQALLDVRLWRRATGETAFAPTAAGFRLSAAQADEAADALKFLSRRAAEMALWTPVA